MNDHRKIFEVMGYFFSLSSLGCHCMRHTENVEGNHMVLCALYMAHQANRTPNSRILFVCSWYILLKEDDNFAHTE